MTKTELHYPNLQHCSIIPAISSGTSLAPPSVAIDPKCLEAITETIPAIYDFKIEKTVVELHATYETADESPLIREPPQRWKDVRSSLSIPQRDMLQRMKSITNATDDMCADILTTNNFDLGSSINAYYRGSN
mmetsp:Transcript_11342/g.14215  ORF Transcript_11342/g.14215 Transcript_11342/m.14215 type:complete len:133 (+) Transcript_11342:163-561(+)